MDNYTYMQSIDPDVKAYFVFQKYTDPKDENNIRLMLVTELTKQFIAMKNYDFVVEILPPRQSTFGFVFELTAIGIPGEHKRLLNRVKELEISLYKERMHHEKIFHLRPTLQPYKGSPTTGIYKCN